VTGERAAALAALLDRLVPSDEHGPGALESGVAAHVEEALADEPDLDRRLAALAALPDAELDGDPLFELVRRRTIEGTFAGPAGWALLGYPGPRAVWTAEEQAIE
jgi:hypothetical protein